MRRMRLICDNHQAPLDQPLQGFANRRNGTAAQGIGVQLCPGTHTRIHHAQPLQHAVRNSRRRSFLKVRVLLPVRQAEREVLLQAQQQGGAPTPRTTLLDRHKTCVTPRLLKLLLRGPLECPHLIHGITDRACAPEAPLLVGVVDQKDRGGGEQDSVVPRQPVQGRGEVGLVLVEGTSP